MMQHSEHAPRARRFRKAGVASSRLGAAAGAMPGATRAVLVCALMAVMVVLAGCATTGSDMDASGDSIVRQMVLPTMQGPDQQDTGPIELGGRQNQTEEPIEPTIDVGSGDFINQDVASKPTHSGEVPQGQVTFNFENQPIQAVVKAILGDLLNKNYIIAPGVRGKVSYSTAQPVRVEDAMPILQTLLGWTNNTLIFKNGRYTVLPIKQAIPGNLVPRLAPAQLAKGYEVRIFPLEYISPSAMEKLLKPFAPPDAIVMADPARSLLIMAGTPSQLRNYQRTINTFDVDWLGGMSVGIYTMQNQGVEDLMPQLQKIFGDEGKSPLAGMFRFIPIKSTNSIIVITPQPDYLDKAKKWLARLDAGAGASAGRQLYIYNVINMEATALADYLNSIFNGLPLSPDVEEDEGGDVAPGMTQVEVGDAPAPRPMGGGDGDGPRITAVEENNQLLVLATPTRWNTIQLAAERLDIQPLQVQIEAKVLEVQLSGEFRFGVQWYLEGLINSGGAVDDGDDSTTPVVSSNKQAWALGDASAGLGSDDTFFYSFLNNELQVALHAMQANGNTKVLSAPSVVVTNNEEASLSVGKSIPITQTYFRPGFGNGGGVNNDNNNFGGFNTGSVSYRDTGITLEVTPRVNPGGLVYMEIRQEVSSPGATTAANGNPPINKRTLETKVAVQSGQTVMLGGLIQENDIETETGVPLLSDIPYLGRLFGATTRQHSRTELLILITPSVIRNSREAARITREYQNRFHSLKPLRMKLEAEKASETSPQPEPEPGAKP